MSLINLNRAVLVAAFIGLWSHAQANSLDDQVMTILAAAKVGNFPIVLDGVDTLDKRGKAADQRLISLLDYYLGEGPGEVLSEAITRRGKRMIKPLQSHRSMALNCLPDYELVCMSKFADGLALRNDHIDVLVAAIRRGRVLHAPK